MTLGFPPPGGDVWRGNYTDDLALFTVAQAGSKQGRKALALRRRLLRLSDGAHAAARTQLSETKRQRARHTTVVWGAASMESVDVCPGIQTRWRSSSS